MALLSSHSGLMRFWLGPQILIVFDSPEYIKKIVNHPDAANKPYFYFVLAQAMGDGLITSPGE